MRTKTGVVRATRLAKQVPWKELMRINGILETALYVADPTFTANFYRRVFGFPTLLESERLVALNVSGSVLLLFRQGSTGEPFDTGGGVIPAHPGVAPTHFAFSIATEDVERWKAKLEAEGVKVESVVEWPQGAKSVYFRDPDGNLAELITPGFWTNY
jgi:catechol 2,3-dioxygenase-like lactoylglutathione lyase family enzyme